MGLGCACGAPPTTRLQTQCGAGGPRQRPPPVTGAEDSEPRARARWTALYSKWADSWVGHTRNGGITLHDARCCWRRIAVFTVKRSTSLLWSLAKKRFACTMAAAMEALARSIGSRRAPLPSEFVMAALCPQTNERPHKEKVSCDTCRLCRRRCQAGLATAVVAPTEFNHLERQQQHQRRVPVHEASLLADCWHRRADLCTVFSRELA